ncbi:MAG: wax ester/triacylglycerol synthase domain-containing protein [Actinomycetota bacterium]
MTDAFEDRASDFATEMSAEEALMWRVAADPWLDPSGALLVVTDRPVDRDVLRAKLAAGIVEIPRLAERVVEPSNPLEAPRWELDPHFDLDAHIIERAVADPGDHRALLDLVARLQAEVFAEGRPPWLIVNITGLADGRGAMLSRLHHAVADGIGSLRMAEIYVDLERTPDPPPPIDLDAILAQRRAETEPAEPTDTTDLLVAALAGPFGLMRSAAAEIALIGADPARAQRAGSGALDTLRTVADQLVGDPYLDSTSELWTRRSGQRYYLTARMPLDAAKAAAKRRGGTINDLYVTALADAAIAYHAERGTTPRSVAMSFVRSIREGGGLGGNAFVPIKVRAPGGDADPAERFAALHDAMAPDDDTDDPGLDAVSSLAGLIPTPVLTRLGRDQGRRIDIVTSNLRGAPIPIFIGGARVDAAYPIGPVAGAACNATVMSYDGSLDIGIMVDPAAIDDPDRFGELVQQVLDTYASE